MFGAASGMGRASAELLTSRDADVAVVDRPGSADTEVAAAVGGSFHPVDVTDSAGTEAALAAAVDALGGLHVTVTTAGGGVVERTLTRRGRTISTRSAGSPISTRSRRSTSAGSPRRT